METLERMPFKAQNMIFGRLEEVCNLNSLSRQERLNYDESLKVYRDGVAVIKYAEQRGLEKGREEGKLEGRIETLAASIRNMRNAGLDDSTIALYLNLSPKEIAKYYICEWVIGVLASNDPSYINTSIDNRFPKLNIPYAAH